MLGFISKMFGGSKSEKDVKRSNLMLERSTSILLLINLLPMISCAIKHRNFVERIKEHLTEIDEEIRSCK